MANHTVSIPQDLEETWYKIPNRSGWIASMLRNMKDIVVEDTHHSWSSDIRFCNQRHRRGPCDLCMKEKSMNHEEIIAEYDRRMQILGSGQAYRWDGE